MSRAIGLSVLTAAFLVSPMLAQQPTFRANVDAVEVDVSVTRDGRPVAGLSADNFIMHDDGAPQTVHVEARRDLPLRVILALDTSASVSGERLQRLIEAGRALNDTLRDGDQISLITFSADVRLRVPMGPPGANVRNALAGLSGAGPTALYDALSLALASDANQRTRSLILLFSDGGDSASWMPVDEVMNAVQRSGAVIHVVGAGGGVLDDVVKAAGGRSWGSGDLKDLFTKALEEMRERYVLSYTTAASPRKGWHAIDVSLTNARGTVHARPGYFVP